MEGVFPDLREIHTKLLQSALLHGDLHTAATLITPCSPGEPPNNPGPSVCVEELPVRWVPRDVTLLQLSLIQILVIKAENICTEPQVRRQYSRVAELLLETGADTKIIGLLQTSDKVLSHISSKCLSYLVLFQHKHKNEVNNNWIQFCLKSLCQNPGSHTLIPCLTSLLCVCKGILSDQKVRNNDSLLGFLVPLEDLIERFCSFFVAYLSAVQCPLPALDAEAISQISCLLDLIEVLVALRTELKLDFSFCKQVISTVLPHALRLTSCPVPYFVKKQLILVLKRCLLQKAGEDFLPSPHTISHQQDALLDQEMVILARSLLGAVQQGRLLQVPVGGRSSSFGGAAEGSEPGPDLVILGAVSLSIVKAMEILFHNEGCSSRGPGCSEVGMDLHSYMAHLLDFLKHHLRWTEKVHACEWVSLIFIEQDDDMLEMAKCLLKMYLYNPSLRSCSSITSGDEQGPWSGSAHQYGINPHCIFLFLLHNVLYDASVLLDFLISSETCFLEYLVRYLKLLKEDWHHFNHTCTLFDRSVSPQLPSSAKSACTINAEAVSVSRVQDHYFNIPHLHMSTRIAATACDDMTNNSHSAPSYPSSCDNTSSFATAQRLVEYDSSEDSESEPAEGEQYPITICSSRAVSTDIDKHMKRLELRAGRPIYQSTSASVPTGCNASQFKGVQQKSAQCLEDLREAISRLHRKKLFPYNPSALLRLLTHVHSLNLSG